uniref:Hairy-related 13 n=1 Tax=Salarias fasciatus TaxID=181472 RepID=A0A672GV35_SALFA
PLGSARQRRTRHGGRRVRLGDPEGGQKGTRRGGGGGGGTLRAHLAVTKPLVEKKRRARINESLLELRSLLSDTDVSTQRRGAHCVSVSWHRDVQGSLILLCPTTDTLNREASERFAAGYIQCMHEVHMFVSSCPGIDATVAAELLNHLLESMPLNEDHLQDVLLELITDSPGGNGGVWHGDGETLCSSLASPGGEDLCSDLDETDSEHNQSSTEASMWRPW